MDKALIAKSRQWLNFSTVAFLLLKGFGVKALGIQPLDLDHYLPVLAAILLCWQIAFGWSIFPDFESFWKPNDENLRNGYILRFLVLLWAGHSPLAISPTGFWFCLAIEVALMVGLVVIGTIAYTRNLDTSSLVIGCLVLAFLFYGWTKHGFITNYGVKEIRHWLEKPNYYTKQIIQLRPADSDHSFDVMADIHVENSTESEDDGYDRFGQSVVYTYQKRQIWIQKLYFSGSRAIEVSDQLEPLDLGESTTITDVVGNEWRASIKTPH